MKQMFSLETTPDKLHDSYFWADYIELLCIANLDEEISITSFIDRVRERDMLDDSGEYENSEHNDKWIVRGEDWFRHFPFRQAVFDDFYPFQVNSGGSILSLQQPLSDKQLLYIYLLMASNLTYFSNQGGNRNTLTGDFEHLSYLVLKKCLPGWKVFNFGKGPFSHERYRGNIWTKLNILAKDLNEELRAKEQDFSPVNTGDEGLDLVGWFPLDNKAAGTFVVFGQCACTDEWKSKQHTVTYDYWNNRLSLKAHIHSVTFTPICFRNTIGDWHASKDIYTILIDRVRFVRIIEEEHLQLQQLRSYSLVRQFIEQKENLF